MISNTMYQSVSSLIECLTFHFQEEIAGVLLHPHLNIVFWATDHGAIGAYNFQNEVRNYPKPSQKVFEAYNPPCMGVL